MNEPLHFSRFAKMCFVFSRLLQFHNIEIVFDSDSDSQPSEPPRKVRQNKRSRKASPDGSLQTTDSKCIRPAIVAPTATVTSGGGQMMLDNDVLVGYDPPSLMLDTQIESKPLLAKILPPYPAAVTSLLSKPLMAAAAAQTKLQLQAAAAAAAATTIPSQPPPLTKDIQTQSKEDISLLRANPNISMRELFPGEEEMGLAVNIPYGSAGLTRTPEGWTKVMTTIQYDEPTRHLWDELQKPYGNQSSFLRHLILLEKYFRQGDLILSENASGNASIYSTSVQHRLQSFDNRGSAAMNHFLKSSARSGGTVPPVSVAHNPPMVSIPAAYSQKMQKSRASNASEPTSLLKSNYDSRGRPIRYSMPPMVSAKANDFRSLSGVVPTPPPTRKDGAGKLPETVKCTKTAKIPVGLPPELICINTTLANMQSTKAQMEQQAQQQQQPSVSQASPMLQQQQQQAPIVQQPQMPLPQPPPMKLAELKKGKHSGISVSLSGNSAMSMTGSVSGISTANAANASAANSGTMLTPNVIRLPEVLSISERNESRNWRPTLMPVTAGPPALNGQLYQTADGRKLPNLVQVQSGGKPYLISIHDYNRMCIVRRERLLRDQMMQRHHHNQQLQSTAASNSAPPPPAAASATVTSIANALQQSSHSVDSRTTNQHLQAIAQSVMQNLPISATSNSTVTSRHSLPPPYSKPLPNIIDITSKTPAAPLIPPTPLPALSHMLAHGSGGGSGGHSSAKISIPNKILEQNSVIPITTGSGSSVAAALLTTTSTASKSSTLDSLLKVRKPNSASASLLKPNIHQHVSYQLAPKPLPPYGLSPPTSTHTNVGPTIPAIVCTTTAQSLPPFDPNVISITSTPSISAILGMPPLSGDALSSGSTREPSQQSALDILLKSSGGIPSSTQQPQTPPTTTMPTSSMWLWAESLSNNSSNGSSSTSVGSITVTTTAAASASTAALGIDTAAATLLSKIPKSLTVIPQQKPRTSTSSKSSNDDVQIL